MNLPAMPRLPSRRSVSAARWAPADSPPMISRSVPNRLEEFEINHIATASQSSGAAG